MTPPLTERIALVLAECERIIAASDRTPDAPWIADNMTSRFVWFTKDDPDDRIIKVYGGSEAETAATQKFIAASRTFCPAAAHAVLWIIENTQARASTRAVADILNVERLASHFDYLWE